MLLVDVFDPLAPLFYHIFLVENVVYRDMLLLHCTDLGHPPAMLDY
jgi:hypothetical protein